MLAKKLKLMEAYGMSPEKVTQLLSTTNVCEERNMFKVGDKVRTRNGLEGLVESVSYTMVYDGVNYPVRVTFEAVGCTDDVEYYTQKGESHKGRETPMDITLAEPPEDFLDMMLEAYKARPRPTFLKLLETDAAFKQAATELAGKLLHAMLNGLIAEQRKKQSPHLFRAAVHILRLNGVRVLLMQELYVNSPYRAQLVEG